MSHYSTIKSEYRDRDCLVAALVEASNGRWTREMIEVHDKAVPLVGYQGDARAQRANVVIRRRHVGQASNDLGFVLEADGTYSAIVSNYDKTKYNKEWSNKVSQRYSIGVLKKEADSHGWAYEEELDQATQTVQLVLTKWA